MHTRFDNENFGQSYPVSLADHNGFTTSDKAIIDVNVQRFAVGFTEFQDGTWAKTQHLTNSDSASSQLNRDLHGHIHDETKAVNVSTEACRIRFGT